MKTSTILSLGLISIVVLAAGCATTASKVQSETNPAGNFAGYRTFAVVAPAGSIAGAHPSDYLRLSGPMREHLRSSLRARGLAEVEASGADLVFEMVGSITPEVTFVPEYTYVGRSWGPWSRRYPFSDLYVTQTTARMSETGTLSIVAHDRKIKQAVWVGWLTGSYRPGLEISIVTAAIDRILETLPAQAATPAAGSK